jgi:hypothetical protein
MALIVVFISVKTSNANAIHVTPICLAERCEE